MRFFLHFPIPNSEFGIFDCCLNFMSKSSKYSTTDDIDELEALSERLAIDLRKNIRNLVGKMYTNHDRSHFN